jgi:hypothetical protein
MVRLQDMIDDSAELLDNELRELGAYIAEELRRREKEKEDRARKQVMEAIQNFLAAGFSLWVKGEDSHLRLQPGASNPIYNKEEFT